MKGRKRCKFRKMLTSRRSGDNNIRKSSIRSQFDPRWMIWRAKESLGSPHRGLIKMMSCPKPKVKSNGIWL
jgi:hypothetical protein